MVESKTMVKKRVRTGKRAWLMPVLIICAVILTGLLVFAGIRFLIPKPMTLKPGELIRGKITLDGAKPYHIGDLIPVTIAVESKNGVNYQMPDLAEVEIKAMEIRERSTLTTTKLQGGELRKISFLLAFWSPGRYTLPSLAVSYQDPAGRPGSFRLPGRSVTIASLLPENKKEEELLKTDIKGLKGPVGLPPRWDLFWWSLAAIALLVILWLVYRFISQQLKGETVPAAVLPPEPAHVIALRRLNTIRAADYLTSGDFKTFYSELSECAREYLENRFQIRALEMTTEEFLVYVSSSRCLKVEFETILKEFLKSSDLVKFAKHIPELNEANQSLETIRRFVDTTKAVPEQATDPAAIPGQNSDQNNDHREQSA